MSEPYLSEEQQIALFHAVGRRIASIVTNTRGARIAEQVPEIAEIPLLGAFVSLKRNGQLRSCMGTMSDRMPLADAVEQATVHAAKDDPRFPPLAAAELFELEMEIWLLWGMKRVAARGLDRLGAIEIGRHGVQISMGGNRGLLLPGVAIEHGMDARAFLEAVCRKAGIPTDAWKDDRSLLHTFEGRSVRGPLSATENIDKKAADEMIFAVRFNRPGPRVPGPNLAETEELRTACRDTFRRMLDGLGPSRYFAGLFDGDVSGVVLSLNIPGRPPLVCSKISVRPDVHLQSSLVELLQVLAEQVRRFGITSYELRDWTLDLTILWDPTIHGNARRFDISTVDAALRSVMLSSPQGWIVRYDPGRSAETLLQDCVDFLEPDDPDLGEVITFETSSTSSPCLITSVSKPNRARQTRPAAVAGVFYPADPRKLSDELDRMLAPEPEKRRACSAVMVPHAGWRYSGRLAAQTLSQVIFPDRAILFCPRHRGAGVDWAIAPNRFWSIPGGTIESDLELAETIRRQGLFFEYDDEAHAKEHAVEVQLPILARLAPEIKIVGIAMSISPWETIHRGAERLADIIRSMPTRPLLIVSSDMNHYASEKTTRKVDRLALDALKKAVKTGNPEHFFATVLENDISMCGAVPMTFVLETLRQLDALHHVEEVGYTTSAESSGDTDRVVGYAGLLFD